MEDKILEFYEQSERDERCEKWRGRIVAVAISLAVNAGLFALACWSVTRSIGWMFDR